MRSVCGFLTLKGGWAWVPGFRATIGHRTCIYTRRLPGAREGLALLRYDAFTRARYAGRGATCTALPVPLRRPSCFDRDLLLFVEEPDRYFGNVCELDTIFNPHKAYYIQNELFTGYSRQELSKEVILRICAHLSYVPPPLKPCGC
ncbi:hypothetical protein PF002_g5853 [Phytophthora fragariae]|uniref:AP complex mu/sigma subunit domain-containing protein n=1 Tax=Phytophthora fragariae TaxID=53985 RepID=A0A6A4A1B5_9STRA|nr:hypothetical protein PF002_g5853 [Phytophthora fragariae]